MIFTMLALLQMQQMTSQEAYQKGGIDVATTHVRFECDHEPLDVALSRLLRMAKVEYAFTPEARRYAHGCIRTCHIRNETVNNTLYFLINNFNYRASPVLTVRRFGRKYVIEQPRVTLTLKDASPEDSLRALLSRSGTDYCVDLSRLGSTRVNLELRDEPFAVAFRRVLVATKPSANYIMDYHDGFTIVRTSGDAATKGKIETRRALMACVCRDAESAVAALCECMSRGYVFTNDAKLPGTVQVGADSLPFDKMMDRLLNAFPVKVTYTETRNTIAIHPHVEQTGGAL